MTGIGNRNIMQAVQRVAPGRPSRWFIRIGGHDIECDNYGAVWNLVDALRKNTAYELHALILKEGQEDGTGGKG